MRSFFISLILILFSLSLKSQVTIEVSKNSIDFGEVPFCKKITDTIVVKNSPNSTGMLKLLKGERITGSDAKNFRITNPKIKDLDLPPYDGTNSVIYVVEFDASIPPYGTKSAYLEIPNDTKDSILKIPIRAQSTIINYEINPKFIDFKDISINQDYTAEFTITLNSNFTGKISSIKSSDPTKLKIDKSGNLNLIPNEEQKFTITLNLDKIGIFYGSIEIKITEPCDTTFVINVKANAPNGFIEGFKNVDLGIVSECETKTIELPLKFNGFGSGIITKVELDGDGKENIQINFSQNFPIQFSANGANEICYIKFQAFNKNYGKKKITATFSTEINAEQKQNEITIDYELAEVKLTADQLELDFPDTYPNQTTSKFLEISNPTPFDIRIESYNFVCTENSAFSITPLPNSIVLPAGSKQTFEIKFIPILHNNDYDCNLEIAANARNCNTFLQIPIKAKSLSKAKFALSFGNLSEIEIDPTAEVLQIPLTINTIENEITITDELNYQIVFPRSVFFINKIISNNTTITSNSIVNNDRVITLKTTFNNTTIKTQKQNIAIIEGIPLLGDVENGNFIFKNYSFAGKNNSYELSDVTSLLFKTKVCNSPEPRLLSFSQPNKNIIEINNRNDDFITIQINAIESGTHKIYFYDYLGKIIVTYVINAIRDKTYQINFNTNQIINNLVFIQIATPSVVYNKRLFYTK